MRIIALTDIHGRLKYAPALAEELRAADLVLLPGDLTQFGNRDAALEVVETVRNVNPNVLAVVGNCDYPDVAEFFDEQSIGIHASHKIVDGVAFAGLGGSLPCPIQTLNEWSEEQIEGYLDAAVAGLPASTPLILVSHQPPKNTVVDKASNGMHVGSASVRAFIEERQPLICFSGHIHEAVGTDAIGPTKLINPGPFFQGSYAVADLSDRVPSPGIRCIA